MVFEGTSDFPSERWKLYRDGFKTLLKSRSQLVKTIREPFYATLSANGREALFCQLALLTFEKGLYFFDLDTAEQLIKQTLPNCLNCKKDHLTIEELEIDAFLNAIESQHGILAERAHEIYSFSHLTFQEYFAARQIVKTVHLQSLETLASHFTESRWREVLFLALDMLQSADTLLRLMQQQTDGLLAGDEKLQQFLAWVDEKANSTHTNYKTVTIRAIYFAIALNFNLNLTLDLDNILDLNLDLASFLDLDFSVTSYGSDLDDDLIPDFGPDLNLDLDLNDVLNFRPDPEVNLQNFLQYVIDSTNDSELQRQLQQLKDRVPDTLQEKREIFEQWWQTNSQAWVKQLQMVIVQYRNIGHDWQFSDAQKQRLQQYYDANKLLVLCLRKKPISDSLRQEIEGKLLLPLAEIAQRESSQ